MTQEPERRELTDEDRAQSAAAIEQLKRDLAAAKDRPPRPQTSPGKFTEPIGLDAEGNYQPPLTAEEQAHLEEVRRRALESGTDE